MDYANVPDVYFNIVGTEEEAVSYTHLLFVAAFVKLPDQFGSDEGVQRNSQE